MEIVCRISSWKFLSSTIRISASNRATPCCSGSELFSMEIIPISSIFRSNTLLSTEYFFMVSFLATNARSETSKNVEVELRTGRATSHRSNTLSVMEYKGKTISCLRLYSPIDLRYSNDSLTTPSWAVVIPRLVNSARESMEFSRIAAYTENLSTGLILSIACFAIVSWQTMILRGVSENLFSMDIFPMDRINSLTRLRDPGISFMAINFSTSLTIVIICHVGLSNLFRAQWVPTLSNWSRIILNISSSCKSIACRAHRSRCAQYTLTISLFSSRIFFPDTWLLTWLVTKFRPKRIVAVSYFIIELWVISNIEIRKSLFTF